MPVTVEHDIADHQDRGLIESRHGQLHGATHIKNEQGRDINTGLAKACLQGATMSLARPASGSDDPDVCRFIQAHGIETGVVTLCASSSAWVPRSTIRP